MPRGSSDRGIFAAQDALSNLRIKSEPIDPMTIANKLGIEVELAILEDDLSGMAFVEGNRRLIWVNKSHHENRQRFTLAHEIGHHVMHHNLLKSGVHVDRSVLRRSSVSSSGTVAVEVEANAFASELLMPEFAVHNALEESDKHFDLLDEEFVRSLASRFQVSAAAMQYRLMRL